MSDTEVALIGSEVADPDSEASYVSAVELADASGVGYCVYVGSD